MQAISKTHSPNEELLKSLMLESETPALKLDFNAWAFDRGSRMTNIRSLYFYTTDPVWMRARLDRQFDLSQHVVGKREDLAGK